MNIMVYLMLCLVSQKSNEHQIGLLSNENENNFMICTLVPK